ncbi:hypothetical protein LY78DRAFT_656912 [Colletotrichum sublineola]|uniref:Uncharacterized protein n=1 Tax=Colletotrichum sublineola TaxID=1173701 RepID=A0A066X4A3_COLSU|nr:hypothetical protein LY78DRAFT_656912 [Colletotrichum sublineola]KDN60840.1 hypothetical protein CSUB01_04641 [Colletotrichum sublineola]
MLARSILAILGASALAAADPTPPVVTPFLTAPGGAYPTTLISIPLSTAMSSTAPPSLSNNSTTSTLTGTITRRVKPTRTITLRPAKPTKYEECGGFRPSPKPCPASFECIKNPFEGGCGPACDGPGICVVPIMCSGIAGIPCPTGKICVDDPRDDCNPLKGGRDCAGLCL